MHSCREILGVIADYSRHALLASTPPSDDALDGYSIQIPVRFSQSTCILPLSRAKPSRRPLWRDVHRSTP